MSTLIEIAAREVGVREEGGNNKGVSIERFQKATWLAVGAWPWCAAFTAYVLQRWLQTPEGVNYLDGRKADDFRCKDASAFGWVKWAQKKGLMVMEEDAPAMAGDFVVFDFSHIGIVEYDSTSSTILTIEGNTNGKGERDSTSGDGVWRKARARPLVKNFIRL
jgi:hypothetical protein